MKQEKHEEMKLLNYSCLIFNIQKALDITITQLIEINNDTIIVIGHKEVSKTYKIKYNPSTFTIVNSKVLGEQPLTKNYLYIKNTI